MSKGSKIALVAILLLLVGIMAYRYDQYALQHNFVISSVVSCDPETEACFVADCSPESDSECDTSPYKKVEISAAEAPACLQEHTCEAFSCEGKNHCSVLFCDTQTLQEGEVCSTPNLSEETEASSSAPEE